MVMLPSMGDVYIVESLKNRVFPQRIQEAVSLALDVLNTRFKAPPYLKPYGWTGKMQRSHWHTMLDITRPPFDKYPPINLWLWDVGNGHYLAIPLPDCLDVIGTEFYYGSDGHLYGYSRMETPIGGDVSVTYMLTRFFFS